MSTSPHLLTIKVEKLIYGGDGLGRLMDSAAGSEGQAVFIRQTLPGEVINVRVLEKKSHYLRAAAEKIIEPAPERIIPRCRHFGICGGCHYQHIPASFQIRAKVDIFRDQMERIGKIQTLPSIQAAPSPLEWNYRNNVQFHLSPRGELGFKDITGRNIFSIQECFLPEEQINEIWPNLKFNQGQKEQRISLRHGSDEQVMLVMDGDSLQPAGIPKDAGLTVVQATTGKVRVISGEGYLHFKVCGQSFRVSPQSFFQVNSVMAEKMVLHIREILPVNPSTILLDAYCGVGLFSAFFAGAVRRVIAVESSPSACQDFEYNLHGYDNVELHAARVEEILPRLAIKPDVVIVDPPRAGLEAKAREAILKMNPRMLAYVSCDPSTLARDAAIMISAGYEIRQMTIFDLFPQTYHIESITLFEK